MTTDHLQPGAIIADRFEVIALAGGGGMGAVYRATDREAGGIVALKLMHGRARVDAARFEREALMLAELRHPAVVRYVAHGVTPAGQRYLAMEWLEGEDLQSRLARGPLSVHESLDLVRRLAEALATAHGRSVVHRDLKPANVFLVDGDLSSVKLLDFGVARVRDARQLTRTGVMIGTPQYMAPEQARGLPSVDARADVFSLGCVLYECIAGYPPFDGEQLMAVLAKILFEEPRRLGDVVATLPSAVDDLVARMLSKDPADRPADGLAVADAILTLDAVGGREAPPASAPRVAITSGERRVLSVVLVASLTSSLEATIDQRTDPTLATDQYPAVSLDPLREHIESLGGRLERLADGSLVVTVSGAGAPTEQAAKAARCALALRREIPAASMALATGHGEVLGRLPAGEVIDRAAALLGGGGGDTVPLDDVTAGLITARFDVTSAGGGLALVGEREVHQSTRTLLGKPQPCVGRDREIATLVSLFDEAAGDGVARVVLVTGPPGVGKSRVGSEFLSVVRAKLEPSEIWIARGDPMGAGSSFMLAGQLLCQACALRAGEPIETRQQKLRARVARHAAPGDVDRIAAFLGELSGAALVDVDRAWLRAARADPVVMGDQVRMAWTEFVARECAAQPVLIVLEDLQWGDLPSVRLIDAALRQCREQSLLVAAFARPEVSDAFPALWAARGLQEVRLAELGRRAAERLVRHSLGGDAPDDLVDRIVERAGGNAFFLEELVRAAAEGHGESLPQTVVAMVQARLDRFEPEVRRTLRAASVFGKTFWRGAVASLVGEHAALAVEAQLAFLVDSEVIEARPDARFPGEREYVFRQETVREAAYTMLTTTDRVTAHRLAAEWLSARGETDPVVLASHYELCADDERALACWLRAAEQALHGEDLGRVISHVARGVACGAQGRDLGALRCVESDALRWRGDFAQAESRALEALSLLDARSERRDVAAGIAALAAAKMGHVEVLERLALELALERPGGVTGPRLLAVARAAVSLLLSGRKEVATKLFAWLHSEAAAVAASDPFTAGRLEAAFAIEQMKEREFVEVMRMMERAIGAFEAAGDHRAAAGQRVNLSSLMIEVGAYARALPLLHRAIADAERLGASNVVAFARMHLGTILGREGRFDEAYAVLDESLALFERQNDRRFAAATAWAIAILRLRQGDAQGAESIAARGLTLAPSGPIRAQVQGTLASAVLLRADVPGALAVAAEAMTVVDALGGLEEGDALVRIAYAEALHASGQVDLAREVIGRAKARILERVVRVTDDASRESWLAIWENVRTLELADAWV